MNSTTNTAPADPQDETDLANMPTAAAAHFRSIKAKMEARTQQGAEAWEAVTAPLRERIGEGNFERWFKDMKPALTADGQQPPRLRLAFPTGFIREQVEARFGDYVREAWRIIEPDGTLELAIQPAEEQPPKAAAKRQTATEPAPEPEQKGQLILFPQWADDRRAAVHAIFRSALFPALNFKEGRPFLKEQRIVSVKGLEVFFTGEQFDQSDLDVYLELLNIAHESPFGVECCFSAYSLLKALGRATGKANHKWLHTVLIRLRSGTPDMTDHGIRYFGGLIEGGFKDETTKHYSISINPNFARLFKAGMWASIDLQQRRDLGRNQTAKALHAYYSTHAPPGPHNFDTLAGLIGLQNKQSRDVRANLIKAHSELKRVGFLSDYEAGAETIKTAINHTPSQARHIAKQIIKSRKKTRRNDE